MSAPTPQGESLRRAIRWISAQLEEDAERALLPLVDQATLRFDLSPRESEYLIGFYRDAQRAAERGGGGGPT